MAVVVWIALGVVGIADGHWIVGTVTLLLLLGCAGAPRGRAGGRLRRGR